MPVQYRAKDAKADKRVTPDQEAVVVLHESKKRSAYDTCVYVCKPGDRKKRMIVISHNDTWQKFMANVSAKLDIEARRVFNQHDEISDISDLVQGDVLFVQPAGEDDSPREALMLKSPAVLNWNRVVRLVNLQCVKGYVISEIVKTTKLAETLKARRVKDDAQVFIKRLVPNSGVRMSTLKAYMLQCWSVRHPNFAHYSDIFVSDDKRRPLGGAKSARKVRKGASIETLVIVMPRYEENMESLLEQRLKLQKFFRSEEIINMVWQVLEVQHYMHSDMKLCHRNVKLSNLLLDQDNRIYLTDIGLPRCDPSATSFHMRNACRGSCAKRKGLYTPYMTYCSPEAFRTGQTSEKEDIWALGCIITELVTHKHVSDRVPGSSFGRNQGAVAQAVAEVGIKDSALGGLCRIMLESDPDKRPTAVEIMWKHMRNMAPAVPLKPETPMELLGSATEAANMQTLATSNDIPTLIAAILRKEHFKGMEVGITRLHEILLNEPTKRASMREVYATPFGRMTGITALCTCIMRGAPRAQQRGAAALRTALLDDDNESHVTKNDIQALVAACIMGNAATQAHAAAALANVCNNHGPSREAMHEFGGVGALTALVVSSNGLAGPLLEAASAIRNACIGHSGNREDVMACGGIAALVKAIGNDSVVPASMRDRQTATFENVAGALRNACNQHNGNCMQLAEVDGLTVAMHLSNAPMNVQEQVVGLVRNACVGYYGNKRAMTKCGAYWSMVQMLAQPSITQQLREDVIAAIRYSTVGNDQNKTALGEAGLVRAIVNIITPGQCEGTMRAKEEAAAALRIACDGSEQNAAEMLKCSGISILVQLLSTGSIPAREESVAAIANACSYFPPNLEFIGESGKMQLQAVCHSQELSEESRLYAKCVLMQVEQKGAKNSIGIPQQGEGMRPDSRQRLSCPSSSHRGERLGHREDHGTQDEDGAALGSEWVSLPKVSRVAGEKEEALEAGNRGNGDPEGEPPRVQLRFQGVKWERYKPHSGAVEAPHDVRWPAQKVHVSSARGSWQSGPIRLSPSNSFPVSERDKVAGGGHKAAPRGKDQKDLRRKFGKSMHLAPKASALFVAARSQSTEPPGHTPPRLH